MFTRDELLEIRSALEYGKNVDSYLDEVDEALRLIDRELLRLLPLPDPPVKEPRR